MSVPSAVFVSRRLQAVVLAILCLAAGRLATAMAEASPAPDPPTVGAVRGLLRR